MKKFIKYSTLIVLIVLTLAFTACSNAPLSVNGHYWFKEPASFPIGFEEVLTYDVSFVHKTQSNSNEVKKEGYEILVEDGKLITTLKTEQDASNKKYVYKTEFYLKASFVTPNNEPYSFEDSFVAESKFTSDFKPISTTKVYKSTLSNYNYEYQITYGGKNAEVSLIEYAKTEYETPVNYTINNYLDGAFIDNDAILFLPRAFNIDSSFNVQFSTIDVLSRKLQPMAYQAYLSDENKIDVKNLPNPLATEGELIECNHITLRINDTFAGSPIECYYATKHTPYRHRLIELYTTFNFDVFGKLGYLKYQLVNVNATE